MHALVIKSECGLHFSKLSNPMKYVLPDFSTRTIFFWLIPVSRYLEQITDPQAEIKCAEKWYFNGLCTLYNLLPC